MTSMTTEVKMPHRWILPLTLLALLAFAANSVLCRLALVQTTIEPADFTAIRLVSGAVMLGALAFFRGGMRFRAMIENGDWPSAFALLAYAVGFSFAYVGLPTGTGALLLFGAVQGTMLGHGLRKGESLRAGQWLGLLLACAGVVALLLPGIAMPSLGSAMLMLGAGVAWGVYSLRGRSAGNPLLATTGNFVRAAPLALVLAACLHRSVAMDPAGIGYAVASGAVASGLGYAVWYLVLPDLKATIAATLQLGVPAIAALFGTLLLAEPITPRLLLAAIAVLGGLALVVLTRVEPKQH